MPDGMRWNFHTSPACMIVWPALLPPWKRTTTSACSASRSMTLPLPSSPHWAPTTTVPGIAVQSVGAWGLRHVPAQGALRRVGCLVGHAEGLAAQVGADDRQDGAHLLQARDRPQAHLVGQLGGVVEVRRQHDRLLLLVARVDDRVE